MTIASTGLVKNDLASFPIYLTNKLESRDEVVKKSANNVYIIHIGHLLKSGNSKLENESLLSSLKNFGINLVHLTLEDLIIIDNQEIDLEKFDQVFLNSSVVSLSTDAVYTKKNVTNYIANDSVAFIGLSDTNFDINLKNENFIVSDYVLSILKLRKTIQKENSKKLPVKSFIIVHTLDSDINQVMERLPPNFINSLAD